MTKVDNYSIPFSFIATLVLRLTANKLCHFICPTKTQFSQFSLFLGNVIGPSDENQDIHFLQKHLFF